MVNVQESSRDGRDYCAAKGSNAKLREAGTLFFNNRYEESNVLFKLISHRTGITSPPKEIMHSESRRSSPRYANKNYDLRKAGGCKCIVKENDYVPGRGKCVTQFEAALFRIVSVIGGTEWRRYVCVCAVRVALFRVDEVRGGAILDRISLLWRTPCVETAATTRLRLKHCQGTAMIQFPKQTRIQINSRIRSWGGGVQRTTRDEPVTALKDIIRALKDMCADQSKLQAMVTATEKVPDPRLSTDGRTFVSRVTLYSITGGNTDSNSSTPCQVDDFVLQGGSHAAYRTPTFVPSYTRAPPDFYRPRPDDKRRVPPFNGKEDWRGPAADFAFGQLPREVLNNYREIRADFSSRFRVVESARSFTAKNSRRDQRDRETVEAYAAEF
ncbi:LOW QUALITY PROTEIN: hypothetical protein MAR_003875 [Mya arenaria]|uniref:Uncharacterized protein n=1 Tax=Mya arenaria TaxID=6604 RepID=A0ABY7EVA6_MYAAR|nr:LOW QUALITY PROTEIN: hypothetical protein MAR_003875 [Mya arenaria]